MTEDGYLEIGDMPEKLGVDLESTPTLMDCVEVLKEELESEQEFMVRSWEPRGAKAIRVYKFLLKQIECGKIRI